MGIRELSVGDLARMIGGRLNLGTMPPLGGIWEPVHRLVTDGNKLQNGDVFVALDPKQRTDDGCDEAFARGALGVVTRRSVEPWAGRFSIQVDQPAQGLRKLEQWAREAVSAVPVVIVGSVGAAAAGKLITRTLETASRQCVWTHGASTGSDFTRILNLSERDVLLAVHESGQIESIRKWLERNEISLGPDSPPGILVITGSAATREATSERESRERPWMRFLRSLPAETHVILNGDDPVLRSAAHAAGVPLQLVGREMNCDLRADQVRWEQQLTCQLGEVKLRTSLQGRHHLITMLATVAVGQRLGLRDEHIRKVLEAPDAQSVDSDWVSNVSGGIVIRCAHHGETFRFLSALDLLGDTRTAGRKMVVLAGRQAVPPGWTQKEFMEMLVRRCGPEGIVVCGDQNREVVDAALAVGIPEHALLNFPTTEGPTTEGQSDELRGLEGRDLANVLRGWQASSDVVLVLGRDEADVDSIVATFALRSADEIAA